MVVHNKDDEHKGDHSSTATTSGVGTLDKKKTLDIDEELSKMLSILEVYLKDRRSLSFFSFM
ncbi:hypothetical protein HPP92_004954 [Vanilla planifolia]|uniref:Uncharacterized protein n=1 Tax=Vanilla planifolia TaxID=51239 RepID=A0A835VEF5_VANPL|nr:hypothetical protein HPP92_005277 [Vanilla planifolia]KAG0493960.1 hypothetical protein HPP92_004954 [Vanilla planifolia]